MAKKKYEVVYFPSHDFLALYELDSGVLNLDTGEMEITLITDAQIVVKNEGLELNGRDYTYMISLGIL